MEDNVLTAKLLMTGLVAAGTALWGWFGWLVVLWAVCMALDYLTGTLAAIKQGDWSSAVARQGLWHKAGMILTVLVAALTDCAISLILRSGVVQFPFDHSILVTVIVLAWYTLTELGSMLENAVELSPGSVPDWLRRFLRVAAGTVNEVGEKVAGEMSEAPPVAEEASEFRGSAPLGATNREREAAGATVGKEDEDHDQQP